MKRIINTIFITLCIISTSKAQSIYFACTPCGLDCDSVHYDKPGICPACNMKVYAAIRGNKNLTGDHQDVCNKKVAVLLFDGVEIIDFAGPWEVFGSAGMKVYSVAAKDSVISTSMGLKLHPDYNYNNAPTPDILLIPGGNINIDDSTTLNWIRLTNKGTEHTMSVCTGAFYLAASGILDNLNATTNYPTINQLKQIAPKTTVLDSVRFVDNGKIITSAGLSSGIDAAFHLVSKYIGIGQTKKLANSLEYHWDDSIYFVRSKLADKYVQDILDVFTPFDYKMTAYRGDTKIWTTQIELFSKVNTIELEALINIQLTQSAGWQKSVDKNTWTMTDNGKLWIAYLTIIENSAKDKICTFEVRQRK